MTEEIIKDILNNKYNYGEEYLEINGQRYHIQIPKEITSDTTFLIAGNSSDVTGDISSTFNNASNNNLIVISPEKHDVQDYNNINNIIDSLSNSLDVKSTNRIYSGYKDSASSVLELANNYAESTGNRTTVILKNAENLENLEDFSALKDSLIVNVTDEKNDKSNYEEVLKKVSKLGSNILEIEYSSTETENGKIPESILSALGLYSDGEIDITKDLSQLTDEELKKLIAKLKLKYKYYSNGQIIELLSQLLSHADSSEMISMIDDVFGSYYSGGTGSLGLVPETTGYYDNGATLSDFADRFINTSENGDTLASNLSFVSNSMNALVSKISTSDNLNTSMPSNVAGISSSILGVGNYLNGINSTLMGKLTDESNAVYSVADAIYQMDGVAALMASSTLDETMSSLYSPSNSSLKTCVETLDGTVKSLTSAFNSEDSKSAFNQLSNTLGTSIPIGGVGKVSISDLKSSLSSTVNLLENNEANAAILVSSIDNFIGEIGASKTLQGGVWDNVKTDLAHYEDLLALDIEASEFVKSAVQTAVALVEDYMGSDTELDDSRLPELRETLSNVQAEIANVEQTITSMENEMIYVCDTCSDANGNSYSCNCRWEHKYTEADIAPYRETLAQLQAQEQELEAEIEKLEGLAAVINQAQSIINDALEQVKQAFENPVASTEGNDAFGKNFQLDLSKYGIDSDSEFNKYMNEYYGARDKRVSQIETAKQEAAKQNEEKKTTEAKPDTDKKDDKTETGTKDKTTVTDKYGNQIDTSNMNDYAKSVLNEVMQSWPSDLEPERLQIVENALSLYGKNIPYSQGPERNKVDANGTPIALDCSSFATKCMYDAGLDVPQQAYTGTYSWNKSFTDIPESQLKPGDIVMNNKGTAGGSTNHIGIYLGKDSSGTPVWIDSTPRNNTGSIGITSSSSSKKGFFVFKTYNRY